MKKEDYKELVKKYTPSEDMLKNMLTAFLSGGIIGVIGTVIYELFMYFNFDQTNSSAYMIVILILLASVLTGLSFFDKLVEKFKCGLIIPITGFAHSVTSMALDNKKDGLITGIGTSVFKLAGSVILYGVIASFILVVIKVVFL